MPLSKAQSCLHFALNPLLEEPQAPCHDGNNESDNVERTALHLPCGEPLYLPRRESTPSDFNEYLVSHPNIVNRARHLQQSSKMLCLRTRMASSTCINVLQGEVAHAHSGQTDVLMSSEATTCHVLAVRSISTAKNVPPLTSLAHVDEFNPDCLEEIVKEHIDHHHHDDNDTLLSINASTKCNNEQPTSDDFGFFDLQEGSSAAYPSLSTASPTEASDFPGFLRPVASMPTLKKKTKSMVHIKLHMVGGCEDSEGTSQQLSKQLLEQWAHLAQKHQTSCKIKLATAAVGGLNTCPLGRPESRGMGIDTRTGEVFGLQEIPDHLQGPAVEIRNARIWARSSPQLSVIHHHRHSQGCLTIEPFDYQPNPQLDALLNVPDPILKRVASTSPECESDRFCSDLRRTVSFINSVPSTQVFGSCKTKPLMYQRASSSMGNLHDWEIATRAAQA